LIVTSKAKSSVPPLAGATYPAICVGIVDIGEQHNKRYNKYQRKVIFTFEIVDEFVEVEGERKPRWLSKMFTSSLNEKGSLRQTLTAWRGVTLTEDELNQFDLTTMITYGCQVAVTVKRREDGGECNEIASITGLAKGMKVGEPISEPFIFNMDDERTWDVLEKMPGWMKALVEKSSTWAAGRANQEKMGMEEEGGAEADGPTF